ncbi:MAG: hypothetical protein HYW86_01625 [Candidatus Roizmanbacteria bacterium]|nr:MAG: hypothetical protein HYW86_01625 [Candidatus Roizmanbacteria bacterium]
MQDVVGKDRFPILSFPKDEGQNALKRLGGVRKVFDNGFTLYQQPSDIQATCTPCAVLNASQLLGVDIPENEANDFIQNALDKFMQTDKELNEEEIKAFINRYGLKDVKLLPFPEEAMVNVQGMLNYYIQSLREGPILLDISTVLSKRDREIQPIVRFKRDIHVLHRVVAVLEGNNLSIIDSYAPQQPEIFHLTDNQEKLRLTSWLISPWSQMMITGEGKPISSENVLQYAFSILKDDALASERLPFAIPQTDPVALKRK